MHSRNATKNDSSAGKGVGRNKGYTLKVTTFQLMNRYNKTLFLEPVSLLYCRTTYRSISPTHKQQDNLTSPVTFYKVLMSKLALLEQSKTDNNMMTEERIRKMLKSVFFICIQRIIFIDQIFTENVLTFRHRNFLLYFSTPCI